MLQETRHEKQERMFQIVEQYHSKNCSQKNFCNERGIEYPIFQYWLRKYQKTHQRAHESAMISDESFIPIEFEKSIGDLIIEYPNGIRICIQGRPDISLIRGLITIQTA